MYWLVCLNKTESKPRERKTQAQETQQEQDEVKEKPVWSHAIVITREVAIIPGKTGVNQGIGTLTVVSVTPLSSYHFFRLKKIGVLFFEIRINQGCPGWCGAVGWMPACELKGHWFDSQSGHMPGLQARSPVGGAREATTCWCFFPSLPSFPSLKINK